MRGEQLVAEAAAVGGPFVRVDVGNRTCEDSLRFPFMISSARFYLEELGSSPSSVLEDAWVTNGSFASSATPTMFAARPADEEPWQSLVLLMRVMIQSGLETRKDGPRLGRDVLMAYPHVAKGFLDISDDIRREVTPSMVSRLVTQGLTVADAQVRAVIYLDQGISVLMTSLRLAREQSVPLDSAFEQVVEILAADPF